MKLLYHSSIRGKLILLFTATAALTVLIACAVLWTYQLVDDRRTLKTEESATAQLVAEESAPALLFHDAAAANETLALLRADPRILRACLYDGWEHVVAQFEAAGKSNGCPAAEAAGNRFSRRHLLIFEKIRLQKEIVGSLYLDVSLDDMYRLLLRFAEIMFGVLLMSIFLAVVISSFLQGIISGPIIALTEVTTHVSDQGNYVLRAERTSDDEFGVLIDRFNAMMDQIQRRETDLQLVHASLEDKVAMRTSDLRDELVERRQVERNLELSKLAAEEANRAKSAFLANMSHELRTPLNAIIGYSEMLYEDAQATEASSTLEDLDKVLYSAKHLLTLISDILDLSKIEAGQMKVHLQPVSASDLLQDVLSTAEILARRNHNTLHVCPQRWDGTLLLDPLRFRQCLLNLLSNSCKFTEHGLISIDIQPQQVEDSQWILWSIRDTGMGISPEGCEKLFKTFSQVDGSATRKHGGSGLGLAISQQLCNAMGAHITAESKLGAGTVFTIHVPVPQTLAPSDLSLPLAANILPVY